MEIKISKKNPEQFKGDLVVYLVRPGSVKGMPVCQNKQVEDMVGRAFELGDFKGNTGESLACYPSLSNGKKGGHQAGRILVLGLGDGSLDCEMFRCAGGKIGGYIGKLKEPSVMIVLDDNYELALPEVVESLTEGVILGSYKFNRHKTKDHDKLARGVVKDLVFFSKTANAAVRAGAKHGLIAGDAACLARDMANEPGNYWTPQHFADFSLQLAKKYGLRRKVLAKKELERQNMGGILGVNQGSAIPPKLICLEYRTGRKVPTLMFVGKGLTFDSGGISLKPSAGMEDMKYDMCGGAAVMAAMAAIGQLQPKNVDIVGIIPTTDNMPGPAALKPGDIVKHYNGKTVEIISTDAEGRLILADALSYGIKKYKPQAVVDLATLTGAVIVGLGHHITGLLGNDDDLAASIMAAGEKSGEPLWRLPLGKEYSKQLESKVADLKNLGGKGAGTITAACFLQEFIGDCPWAHLDIAGTAWDFTKKSYVPKGPSGTGVRTLLELVRAWK